MALYKTATPFFGEMVPGWITGEDRFRLASYEFYKALFKNDDTAFVVTLRNDEESPIYIPAAKRIVRTIGRYTCKDLGFTPVALPVNGSEPVPLTPEDQLGIVVAYGDLFNREEFFANFRDALELGIAQGDFCLFVSGDASKPEGSRLSLRFIDPGTYFPMRDEIDPLKTTGCKMIERILLNKDTMKPDPAGDPFIRVQKWVKVTNPEHSLYTEPTPGVPQTINYETPIEYEHLVYQEQDWEDPTKRVVAVNVLAQMPIPGITQLPIYHFRNRGEPGEFWGITELEGFERLMMGINQGITDEDVALAMQGLGMYATDQVPVNAAGEPTTWELGPRKVIQMSMGGKFERVTGVTSVQASQDHIKYLQSQAESTMGISDLAIGAGDVSVPESGIALTIKFAPIIDESDRKDLRVLAKLTQCWHDLKQWFQVYEGVTFADGVSVQPVVGEKMPKDTEKEMARLQDLYVNGVIPLRLYIEKLNDLGLDLGDPKALMAELEQEAAARMEQQQAMMGDSEMGGAERLDAEAGAPDEE